jgi:Zn-dependent protease with chaperone function
MQFPAKFLDGKSPLPQTGMVSADGTRLTLHKEGSPCLHWEGREIKQAHTIRQEIKVTLATKVPGQNDSLIILEDNPQTRHAIESLRGKINSPLPARKFIPLALAGIVAGTLAFLFLVHHAWRVVPTSADVALGNSLHKAILDQLGQPVSRPGIQGLLDSHLSEFQEPGSPFAPKVHIIGNKMVNAFALPGGNIYFCTGLLDEAESPEELLGILAHELAHVEKRHSMQQITKTAGITFLVTTCIGIVGGFEDLELAERLVEGASLLPMLHYNRKMESEADSMGVEKLSRAGISAKGLRDFFQRLSKDDAQKMVDEHLAWASTHPTSAKRIASISRHIEKEPVLEPMMTPEQWKALQHDPTKGKGILRFLK